MQNMVLRGIVFTVFSLLVACAPADKYPYPPQFVSAEDVPPTVLPAPPEVGSAAYRKGLNTVLTRQRHLSPQAIATLKAEDAIAPLMLAEKILSENNFPIVYSHLRRAGSDAWRINDAAQDYWQSPRPWYADDRVTLHVHHITRPGYPSGHTVTNSVWAHVLGDMLPCKREGLFARARAIGYHRVDAGAHFPFDVVAGENLAKAIYNQIVLSPDYQQEHAAARQELARAGALCPAAKR